MSIIFKMLKYLKNYSNLIKSVIIIALIVILPFQSLSLDNYKSSYQEEKKSGLARQTELDSIRKQNEELKTVVSNHDQLLSEKDKEISDRDTKIHELEEEVKSLRGSVEELTKEKANLEAELKEKNKMVTLKVDGQYFHAKQVWFYLKDLGLNDYVCAGILGNIMAEVGGQTLDFSKWYKHSEDHSYGICQWTQGRKQRLLNDFGTAFEDQLRFLSVELFEVIPKGDSFYNMQDEKEAALYFAKYYERCGSGSYYVRQVNATKALEYFTE